MGRPRKFDEAAVLDAAAAEFRVHGFADTSTDQLCSATGVQRGSLYNAFTSKDELFVRALERYATTYRERQAEILTDVDLSGAERLRAVIDAVIREEEAAGKHEHGAGCMIVHSMMDPGLRTRDERVARIVDQDLRERLSQLEGTIRAGQLDGSISAEVKPADGALLFTAVINGLRTLGLVATPPESLRRAAQAGLAALTS